MLSIKINDIYVDWHVDTKISCRDEDVRFIQACFIDGDELAYLEHINLITEKGGSNRVVKLTGNAAKLLVAYLILATKDMRSRGISEEAINTLLRGRQDPQNN